MPKDNYEEHKKRMKAILDKSKQTGKPDVVKRLLDEAQKKRQVG